MVLARVVGFVLVASGLVACGGLIAAPGEDDGSSGGVGSSGFGGTSGGVGSSGSSGVGGSSGAGGSSGVGGSSGTGGSSGAVVDAGPPGDCPAVLDVQDCDGVATQYSARTADGTEVLGFGVHQPGGGGSGGQGGRRARVLDRRTTPHVLVVSSHDAARWRIRKSDDSGLTAVYAIGVERQRIDAPNDVQVSDAQSSGCAYSPEASPDCDFDQWSQVAQTETGGPVDQFAGCYEASEFEVRDDPSCAVPQPNGAWQRKDFLYEGATTGCAGGEMWIKYAAQYGLWVGAELCASDAYKLYLSQEAGGPFAAIGDGSGSGQDHCELVNDAFTIPNDDDINSGTCATCSIDDLSGDYPGPIQMWGRSSFGQPFQHYDEWQQQYYTSAVYRCGVTIP